MTHLNTCSNFLSRTVNGGPGGTAYSLQPVAIQGHEQRDRTDTNDEAAHRDIHPEILAIENGTQNKVVFRDLFQQIRRFCRCYSFLKLIRFFVGVDAAPVDQAAFLWRLTNRFEEGFPNTFAIRG